MYSNNKRVFSNSIWGFMGSCGAQGVMVIVSTVLTRLLDPSVYGTIALVTVFTAIVQVFVDSGMANALIQKKIQMTLTFLLCFILIFQFV